MEESRKLLERWKTSVGSPLHLDNDFQTHLYELLENFLNRPQKGFRRNFVRIGFDLVKATPASPEELRALEYCGHAIEALHAGSLIVDDIQDQSSVRRGQPTLHLEYGVPKALNAGNWLYFYASHLVKASGLRPEIRLQMYEAIEETLLEAHAGQAMDLGARVHQEESPERIVEICRTSMSLKSGALFRLAIELGALVGGASKDQLDSLRSLGFKTGLCLQMFDDLGNLDLSQPTAKHLEDLLLRRPSYIWWTIAEIFPECLPEFNQGLNALPELELLRSFLEKNPVRAKGTQRAQEFKNEILALLDSQTHLNSAAQSEYKNVIERIAHAYFISN